MSKIDLWKEIDKLREERANLRKELDKLKEENDKLQTSLQVMYDMVEQSVSEKEEYTPYEFSEEEYSSYEFTESGGEDESDNS